MKFLIVILLLFGCSLKSQEKERISTESKLLFKFPEKIKCQFPENNTKEYTAIYKVNIDCSICYQKIISVIKILKPFEKEINLNIVGYGSEHHYFKFLSEELDLFNTCVDPNNDVSKENPLLTHDFFLINREKIILYQGDILDNEIDLNSFKEMLSHNIKF